MFDQSNINVQLNPNVSIQYLFTLSWQLIAWLLYKSPRIKKVKDGRRKNEQLQLFSLSLNRKAKLDANDSFYSAHRFAPSFNQVWILLYSSYENMLGKVSKCCCSSLSHILIPSHFAHVRLCNILPHSPDRVAKCIFCYAEQKLGSLNPI